MVDIEDKNYYWDHLVDGLKALCYSSQTHTFDKYQFDRALKYLDGCNGTRYLNQDFKNLTNALSVFAK